MNALNELREVDAQVMTDSQTDPTGTLRKAAALLRARGSEATLGPWVASFTDRYGWPIDDLDDEDSIGTFTLVAGTALPRNDGRGQGHYESHHMLAEHDDDLPIDQSRELLASLRWAATVHPGLAEPLAAWLDHQADMRESRWSRGDSVETGHALAVARVILGSEDL